MVPEDEAIASRYLFFSEEDVDAVAGAVAGAVVDVAGAADGALSLLGLDSPEDVESLPGLALLLALPVSPADFGLALP